MPEFVILKGWCKWDEDDKAINKSQAADIGAQILNNLTGITRTSVSGLSLPYMRYKQLSFRIDGGRKQCWLVKEEIMNILKSKDIRIHGKELYVTVQQSPQRRERIGTIARALGVMEAMMKPHKVVPDWSSGGLYVGPKDKEVLVGSLRDSSWVWKEDVLKSIKSDFNLQELTIRIESSRG